MITTYKSVQSQRKVSTKSVQGRYNKREGEAFEEIIERSCEYYRTAHLAHIEKTPEPFKITRSLGKGMFEGCFRKQAQPDFKGTISGGRAVVFDAKSTIQDKLSVSVLTEEQRKSLLIHRGLGAWAGVLICYRSDNIYAMIPIDDFLKVKETNGHAYWSRDETIQYRVPMKGLRIDFLQALNEYEKEN